MSGRFRRGAISVGPGKCSGCDRIIHHGEVYLALDEKPSDKLKEEVVFAEDIDCSECGSKLENGDNYLLVLDGDGEKCYCPACYKKKGGDIFKKKNNGVPLKFKKTSEESDQLYFCRNCCEKRKSGMEKKEKGEQVFTFFPVKALK
ncbi:MAG: hypothetical protein NTV42_07670 [Chloroflexi bacterium]|nr:hypothetical protein [Chloroflexota bacterium]